MHADLPRFTGQVEHALDDKGRLIVPARFRERLGTGFILTIAQPDPCLALYPAATWADFCERLEGAPRKDERYR
ncbi:MAG: division/cell wall cluster transcriptional repressor MraZ, partial [Vulcanimicrobiaceae bacterium]